jgi:hypothetical protein
MFATRKTTPERVYDALDLTIDFATLGEYGLEPPRRPSRPCQPRHRIANRRATGAWAAAIDRFAN